MVGLNLRNRLLTQIRTNFPNVLGKGGPILNRKAPCQNTVVPPSTPETGCLFC